MKDSKNPKKGYTGLEDVQKWFVKLPIEIKQAKDSSKKTAKFEEDILPKIGAAWSELGKGINSSRKLKSLTIRVSGLPDSAGSGLIEILSKNTALVDVTLSMPLDTATARAIKVWLGGRKMALRRLAIHCKYLTTEVLKYLGSSLERSEVQSLTLTYESAPPAEELTGDFVAFYDKSRLSSALRLAVAAQSDRDYIAPLGFLARIARMTAMFGSVWNAMCGDVCARIERSTPEDIVQQAIDENSDRNNRIALLELLRLIRLGVRLDVVLVQRLTGTCGDRCIKAIMGHMQIHKTRTEANASCAQKFASCLKIIDSVKKEAAAATNWSMTAALGLQFTVYGFVHFVCWMLVSSDPAALDSSYTMLLLVTSGVMLILCISCFGPQWAEIRAPLSVTLAVMVSNQRPSLCFSFTSHCDDCLYCLQNVVLCVGVCATAVFGNLLVAGVWENLGMAWATERDSIFDFDAESCSLPMLTPDGCELQGELAMYSWSAKVLLLTGTVELLGSVALHVAEERTSLMRLSGFMLIILGITCVCFWWAISVQETSLDELFYATLCVPGFLMFFYFIGSLVMNTHQGWKSAGTGFLHVALGMGVLAVSGSGIFGTKDESGISLNFLDSCVSDDPQECVMAVDNALMFYGYSAVALFGFAAVEFCLFALNYRYNKAANARKKQLKAESTDLNVTVTFNDTTAMHAVCAQPLALSVMCFCFWLAGLLRDETNERSFFAALSAVSAVMCIWNVAISRIAVISGDLARATWFGFHLLLSICTATFAVAGVHISIVQATPVLASCQFADGSVSNNAPTGLSADGSVCSPEGENGLYTVSAIVLAMLSVLEWGVFAACVFFCERAKDGSASEESNDKKDVSPPGKLNLPQQSGNLQVRVIKCNNLVPADKSGLSDPFIVVKRGNEEVHKTEWKPKTLDATFDPTKVQVDKSFEANAESSEGLSLNIEAYDHEKVGPPDFLGEVAVDLCEEFKDDWNRDFKDMNPNEITKKLKLERKLVLALQDPNDKINKSASINRCHAMAVGDKAPFGTVEIEVIFTATEKKRKSSSDRAKQKTENKNKNSSTATEHHRTQGCTCKTMLIATPFVGQPLLLSLLCTSFWLRSRGELAEGRLQENTFFASLCAASALLCMCNVVFAKLFYSVKSLSTTGRNEQVARLFQGNLVVSAALLVFSALGVMNGHESDGAWGSIRTSLGFCDSHGEVVAHASASAVAELNSTLSDTICAVQIVTDFYAHGTLLCAIAAVVASTMCMSVSA